VRGGGHGGGGKKGKKVRWGNGVKLHPQTFTGRSQGNPWGKGKGDNQKGGRGGKD